MFSFQRDRPKPKCGASSMTWGLGCEGFRTTWSLPHVPHLPPCPPPPRRPFVPSAKARHCAWSARAPRAGPPPSDSAGPASVDGSAHGGTSHRTSRRTLTLEDAVWFASVHLIQVETVSGTASKHEPTSFTRHSLEPPYSSRNRAP